MKALIKLGEYYIDAAETICFSRDPEDGILSVIFRGSDKVLNLEDPDGEFTEYLYNVILNESEK